MNNLTKRTTRHEEIRKMVLAAILIAIIVLMTFIPEIGYITIGLVPITIIHIPVIVGGILLGRKYGLILGFVFGLGSMTKSFMEYTVNAPFTNPLLSVVPRSFVGLIASDIYALFTKVIHREKLAVPLALGTVTFIHSLIVLPLLYWVWKSGFFFFTEEFIFALDKKLFPFIWGTFVANSLFEIALAILIGTPLVIVLEILKKNQK
ncbi:MAG TPA: ECF transporter S component [Bacilli bacterium]|nr:MAG: Pantothenic acid transporter PanT [Tenericutes bacterium ADurb.BinA124]HNZ50850.1 ECF transporter S component [Bacilli bacterium]HOH18259.1 ECF transporter S component [Bacilli bacterium]HPX84688.1 ECF transporter S component [Bacilli bacterium]HQC74575.1 ECF transporter S component [Bacilli bacterium]